MIKIKCAHMHWMIKGQWNSKLKTNRYNIPSRLSLSQVKTVCNSTFPQQYIQIVWLHTLCHYDLNPDFIIILFSTCLAFVWILYWQNTFTLFYNSSNKNTFVLILHYLPSGINITFILGRFVKLLLLNYYLCTKFYPRRIAKDY